jgi:maleate isomerase
MIVPSSNTALEPATAALLADRPDITFPCTRIRVQAITAAPGGAAFDVDTMVSAARLLADAKVDCIVWNGTAGSWLGVDHDRSICAAITDATGVAATTSTLAILQALDDFGITSIACATPYTTDMVDNIVAEYARHGVSIVSHSEWGLSDNFAIGQRDRNQIAGLLTDATDRDAQAVALICTNVDGSSLASAVESDIGVPVIDSIAATLWWALELSGADSTIRGFGSLLTQGRFRHRAKQIVDTLRARTGCDRTTLRIDDPNLGLHVDLCAAESCSPGVRSIQHDPSLDQRKLETVVWLEQHRQMLVQPAFTAPPFPPQALQDVYGVRAQVLGPVEKDGRLAAWLSAHSIAEREWTETDIDAMEDAQIAIRDLLHAA